VSENNYRDGAVERDHVRSAAGSVPKSISAQHGQNCLGRSFPAIRDVRHTGDDDQALRISGLARR